MGLGCEKCLGSLSWMYVRFAPRSLRAPVNRFIWLFVSWCPWSRYLASLLYLSRVFLSLHSFNPIKTILLGTPPVAVVTARRNGLASCSSSSLPCTYNILDHSSEPSIKDIQVLSLSLSLSLIFFDTFLYFLLTRLEGVELHEENLCLC